MNVTCPGIDECRMSRRRGQISHGNSIGAGSLLMGPTMMSPTDSMDGKNFAVEFSMGERVPRLGGMHTTRWEH